MVKYNAIARLHYKGKPIGRNYRLLTRTSKKEALEDAIKDNKEWNRRAKKSGYETKLVKINKVGVRKPIRHTSIWKW
jgi:hypothetical protein